MRRARAGSAIALAGALALSSVGLPARGALPPLYGGELRLPATAPIASLDPAEASTPFEAAVAAAVSDGLYGFDRDGHVRPVLAAAMPVIDGTVATITLRQGLVRHAGTPLRAVSVEHSLRRAAAHPQAAWLLAAFARDGAEPDIRIVDEDSVEISLARAGVDVARVLAAAPLALATGRDPRRRPLGSGPFSARLAASGEVRLRAFRFAAEGAPYLDGIRVLPPRRREDALRAFELGHVDGSWHGESLYGGRPVRPVSSSSAPSVAPVLLVPNRSRGALRRRALWEAVASRVDRRRLERVGLRPSASLVPGLPPPRIGTAPRPATRQTLLLPVRDGDAFEEALAEALAGVLDEANVTLRVEALPPSRYGAVVASGRWDLRLATVVPPLPGPTPVVGAALATTGQLDLARSLAVRLDDATSGAAAAQRLEALVLGHRAPVLSHPASLQNVRFDALGRLELGELAMSREALE